MGSGSHIALVRTIKDRCRVCYTCVRECPAKAIRIAEGQAEVLAERCIACGNCVRVCSQRAKEVLSTTGDALALLDSGAEVAACVAPSFPAELEGVSPQTLVGMLRRLGFARVLEVAFGADLVAERYHRLLQDRPSDRRIATTCPAVVGYVTRYHPDLVPSLAPIVSPMVATARAARRLYGPGLKVVFFGPCIAKKAEAASAELAGEVDVAVTFAGMREMLAARGVTPGEAIPSDFDPPRAGLGAVFPVGRGLLESAGIKDEIAAGEVVAVEGPREFVAALGELASGALEPRLLELLSCNGCIVGPGMTTREPRHRRRERVARHARERLASIDSSAHRAELERFSDLDLSRAFVREDRREAAPDEREVVTALARMGKLAAADELNCGACGYDTCREHAVAVVRGLAESEMCLPLDIERLRSTVEQLRVSHEQLARTQEALMHAERLASMGQLAAGIAHEVNNPLGVVVMYAHLAQSAADEGSQIHSDLSMIVEQADRCKRIVASLLDFARENKLVVQAVDLDDLVRRAIAALPVPDGVELRLESGGGDPLCELDPDQMTQVLSNIVSNAYAAMEGGEHGTLIVRTAGEGARITISISDTGCGIPEENLPRIFEPFFTTKRFGRGTGLGLAVTYGIVKMHRGDITVDSNADPGRGPTGTTVTVSLPRVVRREE